MFASNSLYALNTGDLSGDIVKLTLEGIIPLSFSILNIRKDCSALISSCPSLALLEGPIRTVTLPSSPTFSDAANILLTWSL